MKKRNVVIREALLAAGLSLSLLASGCGGQAGTDSGITESTTSSALSQDSEEGTVQSGNSGNESETADISSSGSAADSELVYLTAEYKNKDTDTSYDAASACSITLNGTSADISGSGAATQGQTVTITEDGTYILSGTLNDGQIIVDAGDEDDVRLVLNGIRITNSTSAPIYIKNSDKTVLILADQTENYISDASEYVYANASEDEPDAAVFSKDDLSITGSGSLIVEGNYKDGITSKNDLKITGGTIIVTAAEDGIRGKDSVSINGGTIQITAGLDGLKSNNDSESDQGYIVIDGGTFRIESGNDGIQAETALQINDGTFNIVSGSGAEASVNTEDSQKGLKSGSSLIITGGTFLLDCADDSVHTNGPALISGGSFTIDTGDDAFHSDSDLTIDGGDIVINTCFEGLEGAAVTINDGTIHLTASDDGINAAGGSDTNSYGGRPGLDSFSAGGDYQITINGGYVAVNASGDGLDSNGDLNITGGVVLVNGPVSSGDGALDYGGSCKISGGILAAAGSAGMAQAPGISSVQCSLMITFSSAQQAGTLIHIEDESGSPLISFAPAKTYQSVIISIPEFSQDSDYSLYIGGTDDLNEDGYTRESNYTGNASAARITLTGILTSVNENGEAVSGGFGNFGGFGGQGGGRGRNGGFSGSALPDESAPNDRSGSPKDGSDNSFESGSSSDGSF